MDNNKVEKVGLVFGGFAPLHRGHMDVIYTAKHACDKVLLVICSNEEERDEVLPPDERFKIIDQGFKDDIITVKQYKTSYAERTDMNWKFWADGLCEIFTSFCKTFPNMTRAMIYTSDTEYILKLSAYQGYWQGCLGPVKITYASVNKGWNVHAAWCRENPLKYWEYIYKPFRSYFTHKILIAGASSVGKTTLIQDLSKYYNIPVSEEAARSFQYPGITVNWDFEKILHNIKAQKDANDECMRSDLNPGFFISDSDMVTTMMYAELCRNSQPPSITDEEYKLLDGIVEDYSKFVKWDKIFLIQPIDKPMTDDGFRFVQYDDYQFQLQLFQHQCKFYQRYGYQYEVISVTYEDIFRKVSQYINNVRAKALGK